MDNELLHLCSMANTLSMGALRCTAHLLLLLYPLRLIINACNKCVTLIFLVIMENEDSGSFYDSSAAPLFVSSSVGQDKNITVCRFMFRVRRIYCVLMFHLPCATCTIKIFFHVSLLGMATSRVWTGFFHTRTWLI